MNDDEDFTPKIIGDAGLHRRSLTGAAAMLAASGAVPIGFPIENVHAPDNLNREFTNYSGKDYIRDHAYSHSSKFKRPKTKKVLKNREKNKAAKKARKRNRKKK